MPGELVAAPGGTKRSWYAGSVRSSSVSGAARPRSANQVVSTLTHTLPVSIGASRSVPSPRARSPRRRPAAATPESAKTPSSRARVAKVLSTPKATSPVGLSWVRTSRLVSAARVAGRADVEAEPGVGLELLEQLLGQRERVVGDEDDLGRCRRRWPVGGGRPHRPRSASTPRGRAVAIEMVAERASVSEVLTMTPFAGANRSRFGGSAAHPHSQPAIGLPCL